MKTAYGLEIPDNLRELVNPKRCALIVYDMQVGIVRQIKHGAAITERVKQVLDASRAAGMRDFLYEAPFFAETVDGRVPISSGNGMATRG